MIAVISGANSRTIDMPIMSATNTPAPNCCELHGALERDRHAEQEADSRPTMNTRVDAHREHVLRRPSPPAACAPRERPLRPGAASRRTSAPSSRERAAESRSRRRRSARDVPAARLARRSVLLGRERRTRRVMRSSSVVELELACPTARERRLASSTHRDARRVEPADLARSRRRPSSRRAVAAAPAACVELARRRDARRRRARARSPVGLGVRPRSRRGMTCASYPQCKNQCRPKSRERQANPSAAARWAQSAQRGAHDLHVLPT